MNKAVLLMLAIFPLVSFGSVEPVILHLAADSIYTVPADKILLIEHIASATDTPEFAGAIVLEIASPTNTNRISMKNAYITYNQGLLGGDILGVISFARPLRIPAGNSLRVVSGEVGGYTVFGLLVNSSDLYASIQTETEGILCRNGNFSFDVLAASPRPSTIKLQGSTDLSEWRDIPAAEVTKIKAGQFSASVPMDQQQKYYVKTLLTSVTQ